MELVVLVDDFIGVRSRVPQLLIHGIGQVAAHFPGTEVAVREVPQPGGPLDDAADDETQKEALPRVPQQRLPGPGVPFQQMDPEQLAGEFGQQLLEALPGHLRQGDQRPLRPVFSA